jgi:hypothetical protein
VQAAPVLQPHNYGKDIYDRALVDHESAVHVRFAQPELGAKEELAMGFGRGKPHNNGRAMQFLKVYVLPAAAAVVSDLWRRYRRKIDSNIDALIKG